MPAFYEALGFVQTFRQERPNPYLCLKRGELDIHFASVASFEPEKSLGSILILVPDTEVIYAEFAAGLRERFGKLPVAGIPRITRPRRKQGAGGGFAVVDPGGNWLRITSTQDEPEVQPSGSLGRVMLNAARQGDARGETRVAISILETGLIRHPEAASVERIPALTYLAELWIRAGEIERARDVIAEVWSLNLTETEKAALSGELSALAELESGL